MVGTVCGLVCSYSAVSQTSQSYTINFESKLLSEALLELSEATGVNIVFSADQLEPLIIDGTYSGATRDILEDLLIESLSRIRERGGALVVYKPRRERQEFRYWK